MAAAPLKTEDTGKKFEMAICLSYGIPFCGAYKYDLEEPRSLLPRLSRLPTLFPKCTHTAARGAQYDFTACDAARYLSVKSTKGNTMVAPQCVGQAQPAKFCERLGLPSMEVPALKAHIQAHIAALLPSLLNYTISPACDVLYYNKKTGAMKYVQRMGDVPWDTFTYSWSRSAADWNNSVKLRVHTSPTAAPIPLMEFQFHTKSRTNMAVRWCFETLLAVGAAAFKVTDL